LKKILINGIKFYQRQISPCFGKKCIYTPTCSQYSIDAISEYGAIKGSMMSAYRILRCNPLSKGGFDPVKKNNKEWYFCSV